MADHGKAVFQGFWHGPSVGPLRRACIQSFLDLGYRFEVYAYAALDMPPGVVPRDAGEIIPFEEIFYFENEESGTRDLGPFSDLFRFKLLSERGGWWMDVDTICLSAEIPPVERAWAQQIPEVNPNAIGSGQIAFARGDPLAIELYERCLALSRAGFSAREALGPHLLSACISEHDLPRNVVGTADLFYPLRFIEMFKLWLPEYRDEVEQKAASAWFMPIFQSFPAYIGLDLAGLPPAGSYLGEFCRGRGAGHGRTREHNVEEIREATRRYLLRRREWALKELLAVSGRQALAQLGIDDGEVSASE